MLFCHSAVDGKLALVTITELIYIECILKEFSLFQSTSRLKSCEICNLLLFWGKFNLHSHVAWRAASKRKTTLRLHTDPRTQHQITFFYATKFHLLLIRNINNRITKLSRNYQSTKFHQNSKEFIPIYFPGWNVSASRFISA